MTKIAVIADVHVENHRVFGGPVVAGINARGRQVLEALDGAVEVANEQGCRSLFILGDLFDGIRPVPQLIAETMRILQRYPMVEVTVLLGNHEQVSMADGDHSLAPLARGGIHVVASPEIRICAERDVLFVPFEPGNAREWLPQRIAELVSIERWAPSAAQRGAIVRAADARRERILFTHVGFTDSTFPPWLREAHDSIDVTTLARLMEEHGIVLAVAGNYHTRREWQVGMGRRILQVGALLPANFGDEPPLGEVAVFDEETLTLKLYPVPGPRFYKRTYTPDIARLEAELRLYPDARWRYLRLSAQPHELEDAQKALLALKMSGTVFDGSVELDRTETRAQVLATTRSAGAADTLQGALAAYVERFADVDPAAVQAKVNHYLRGAG